MQFFPPLFTGFMALALNCGCSDPQSPTLVVSAPSPDVLQVVTNGVHFSYAIPSNAVEAAASPTYTIRNDESFANGAGPLYSKAALYTVGTDRVGFRRWWKDGQLSEEVPMLRGVPHGVTRFWREDGELLSESVYDHGQLHGVSRGWGVGGNLRMETPYFDGQRHGLHQKWAADGRLEEQIWYFHGKKHGPSLFFGGRPQIPILHSGKPGKWYFIDGHEVSESAYSAACRTNDTLPKLRNKENNVQPDGAANGSQPIRSQTNRTSSGGWLPSLTYCVRPLVARPANDQPILKYVALSEQEPNIHEEIKRLRAENLEPEQKLAGKSTATVSILPNKGRSEGDRSA